MRYLLCLNLFIGILLVSLIRDHPGFSSSTNKDKGISYFESTSNPPLSAIEDSICITLILQCDHPAQLKKRFGVHIIAGNSFNSKSLEYWSNNGYSSFVKSTSLFSLANLSQSWLKVFLI